MRDYKTEPQIWDEDPVCDHAFYQGDRKSNFCSKCGAWEGELGLEPNPELFVKHLCDVFDEIKRILKSTGSIFVNLGDTYGGSRMGVSYARQTKGSNSCISDELLSSMPKAGHSRGIYDKSLLLIPFHFAIEMANRGWTCRNVLIWHKLNCMPSSAKDRFTVDYENIFFFVKSKKYYFEMQYEPHKAEISDLMKTRAVGGKQKEALKFWENWKKENPEKNYQDFYGEFSSSKVSKYQDMKWQKGIDHTQTAWGNYSSYLSLPRPQGRNMRCVWRIPTQPFSGSHFAVFPEALIEPMIKAGCPQYVCKKCGKPGISFPKPETRSSAETIGYRDCGCSTGFDTGIVLDPFAGSGTTGVVAKKLGKSFILIEIKPEYCIMAEKRLKNCLR